MIVAIVFNWQGRRLGYVRKHATHPRRPNAKRYTHDFAKAAGFDSVEEAARHKIQLGQGERIRYAERYSIAEQRALMEAA